MHAWAMKADVLHVDAGEPRDRQRRERPTREERARADTVGEVVRSTNHLDGDGGGVVV